VFSPERAASISNSHVAATYPSISVVYVVTSFVSLCVRIIVPEFKIYRLSDSQRSAVTSTTYTKPPHFHLVLVISYIFRHYIISQCFQKSAELSSIHLSGAPP